MTVQRRAPRSLAVIFAMPLLLALVSAVGLASALLGDGIWDALSWLTLGALVALPIVCWRISRRRHP
jgi:ABC-type transporter Mla maintaining outer membrane lipid asymmetry permease subunit MlaE